MPWVLARWVGAAILFASATAKLAQPRESRDALGTFGWAAVVALELALAIGIAAGVTAAAYAAGATMLVFAAGLTWQIARGRSGAPCGCFGSRGKVGRPAVARNVALAAFYFALPSLGTPHLSTSGWLAVGLAVALVGVVVLAVAVLALAREVGTLRLAIAPQGALEIPDEGPALGSRAELPFELDGDLGLAVFSSEGCPICQTLEPAIEFMARDPLIALRVFDEHRDAETWRAFAVPGAPYAVALDGDGTVLAKGTFNSLGQLESVMATAERRRREAVHA